MAPGIHAGSRLFYLAPSQTGFSDLASLQKHIDSVSSIANIERNQAFWEWLADFPNALHQVLSCPEFHVYLNWEASWLEEQTSIHADALRDVQDIFTACHSLYHPTTVTDISVVVNPIKCVYSSDYHMIGTQFIFCSGSFHKESVVHEFLHHVVHPVIELHRDEILRHPVSYPGIDVSYYLAGQLNAFEEFFVRKLTDRLLTQTPPDNLSVYLSTVLRSLTPSYNG